MNLLESFRSLLLEIASLNDIQKSIRDRRVVTLYYDGDDPGGKGLRTIEPVAVGYSKRGNLVLRAWDYEGASHRGYTGEKPLPSWRFFRVDKIFTYKLTSATFNTPRPGYNKTGDKSMTKMILNAKF